MRRDAARAAALLVAALLSLLAGPALRGAGGARGPGHRRQPPARGRRRRPADLRLHRPRRRREPPRAGRAAAEEPRGRRRPEHLHADQLHQRPALAPGEPHVLPQALRDRSGRGGRDDVQGRRQGRQGRRLPPRGRDGAPSVRRRSGPRDPRRGSLRQDRLRDPGCGAPAPSATSPPRSRSSPSWRRRARTRPSSAKR